MNNYPHYPQTFFFKYLRFCNCPQGTAHGSLSWAQEKQRRKDKTMTPLEAIRQKCRWCCLDQPKEIELCQSEKSCPIWPLRFGKSVPGLSPLKAIRAKCLDCVGGSPSDVRECEDMECSICQFRFGTNPNISESTRQKRREAIFNSLQKNAAPRGDSRTNGMRAG